MRLLLTLVLLSFATLSAYSYDFEVEGVYYTINDSPIGSVSVTYKDSDYNSYSGFVSIPSEVEFSGNNYKVTSIGEWAFRNSAGLTGVSIPSSVQKIGYDAFYECTSLKSIIIPNSVVSIEDDTFYGCSSLESVILGNSVASIGNHAFYICTSLKSIIIPNSVVSIGSNAFTGCNNLIEVLIGNSVVSIGDHVFNGCGQLRKLVCPENLCEKLQNYGTSITYPVDAHFDANGLVYDKNQETIYFATMNISNIDIPNTVISIENKAFSFCSNLSSIILPSSVKSIGQMSFYECSKLSSVSVPESLEYIGNDAFYGTPWLDNQPEGMVYLGKVAFKYVGLMPESTSITLNDGTVSIAGSAFKGIEELSSITIPSSVTSIGKEAFSNCTHLESIINPNSSISSIEDQAFQACYRLSSFDFPNSLISIGHYAFYDCMYLTSVTIPSSVISIGDYAFTNCIDLQSICVDNSNLIYDSRENCNAIIETASNMLIQGCSNTIIPNSVVTIGSFSFSTCNNLLSITIPSSVTVIDNSAFYSCSSLKSVYIGSGIQYINSRAFGGCGSITKIDVGANNPPICGESVFGDLDKSACTLFVPEESIDNYKNADTWKDFFMILTDVSEINIDSPLILIDNGRIINRHNEYIEVYATNGCIIYRGTESVVLLSPGVNIVKIGSKHIKILI